MRLTVEEGPQPVGHGPAVEEGAEFYPEDDRRVKLGAHYGHVVREEVQVVVAPHFTRERQADEVVLEADVVLGKLEPALVRRAALDVPERAAEGRPQPGGQPQVLLRPEVEAAVIEGGVLGIQAGQGVEGVLGAEVELGASQGAAVVQVERAVDGELTTVLAFKAQCPVAVVPTPQKAVIHPRDELQLWDVGQARPNRHGELQRPALLILAGIRRRSYTQAGIPVVQARGELGQQVPVPVLEAVRGREEQVVVPPDFHGQQVYPLAAPERGSQPPGVVVVRPGEGHEEEGPGLGVQGVGQDAEFEGRLLGFHRGCVHGVEGHLGRAQDEAARQLGGLRETRTLTQTFEKQFQRGILSFNPFDVERHRIEEFLPAPAATPAEQGLGGLLPDSGVVGLRLVEGVRACRGRSVPARLPEVLDEGARQPLLVDAEDGYLQEIPAFPVNVCQGLAGGPVGDSVHEEG